MDDKPIQKPGGNADGATDAVPPKWAGFAEIDRAIVENRLTEYRWKKAWADPWGRRLFICVGVAFSAFLAFVIYQDLIAF